MEDNSLPQELEQIVSKVRLKSLEDDFLNGYSAQVDDKINHTLKVRNGFRFSLLMSGLVLAVAFVGLYYMYVAHNQKLYEVPALIQQPIQLQGDLLTKTVPSSVELDKSANLEDELDTLMMLDPEFADELMDLIDEEGMFDEFSGFDEAEFVAAGLQNPMMR